MTIFKKAKILKQLRNEDVELLKQAKRKWIEFTVQAKKDNCEESIIRHFRGKIDILSVVIAEKETEKEIKEAMEEFEEKETYYSVSSGGVVTCKTQF